MLVLWGTRVKCGVAIVMKTFFVCFFMPIFFFISDEVKGEGKCSGLNIASSFLKLRLEFHLHSEGFRIWKFNWESVEMCGFRKVIRIRLHFFAYGDIVTIRYNAPWMNFMLVLFLKNSQKYQRKKYMCTFPVTSPVKLCTIPKFCQQQGHHHILALNPWSYELK